MVKSFWVIVFLLLFFPFFVIQAQTSNAGFAPGNIWYSQDPYEEGEKIKIYTVVFNPESKTLQATVAFFDKNTLLGKKEISIRGKEVLGVSIDWTASPGSHIIFAKIENPKFILGNGTIETAYLSQTQTAESRRNVSKKIILSTPEGEKENTESEEISADKKIQNFLMEKTPAFISEPIVSNLEKLESWREGKEFSLANKDDKGAWGQIMFSIYSRAWLFYILLIFFVFMIIRYFLKKFS